MPERLSASDFPYEPSAQIERLYGLHKLRAIADRELAGYLFDLWQAIPAQGVAPSAPVPQLRLRGAI